MNRHYQLLAAFAVALALCASTGCPRKERAKRRQAQARAAQTGVRAATPATASAPAQSTMQRVHVFVSGRVQGVGFRAFTRYHALSLRVTGWVKNLPDGRVEAVIEGPSDKVDQLVSKIRRGPSSARVDRVESTEEQFKGEFQTFKITFARR